MRKPRLWRTGSSRMRSVGGGECLEARHLLTGSFVISEFMASNDNGLRDEDYTRPDWIEILNTGSEPASLDGWFLTDSASDLDKWRLPDVSLAANQRMVVFASGKNRADPGGELHTNFRLNVTNDYLALVEPDGLTVAFDFGSFYPPQRPDVSFGIPQPIRETTLISPEAPVQLLVPTTDNGGDVLGASWTAEEFDDSNWITGVNAIGYERGTGYEQLIRTDVEAAMYDVNASAFVRMPFVLENPDAVYSLTLSLQYEDGYVAYLNGQEVARRNAPNDVTWNSAATDAHVDREAVVPEEVEIDPYDFHNLLNAGDNILAIHALNDVVTSSDFLLVAGLRARLFEGLRSQDRQYFTAPSPGVPNGEGTTSLITEVSHQPNVPGEEGELTVSATVVSTGASLPTATLHYRVMYGDETSVPMFDDGLHGDRTAGDGIFGAAIPAGVAESGQMIRYYVTVGESEGNRARVPVFADPLNSEQYFGTVVRDPTLESNLRVLHLFLEDPDASETDAGTHGSLFHDGIFYDNIEVDTTGRSVGLSGPKKSHDVFFTSDHWFELTDPPLRMNDFDLITDFWNRAKVRIPLGYQTFLDLGTPAHLSFPVRVQRNGEFFGTYSFVDGGNERFLELAGLDPRGALYKMNLGFSVGRGTFKKQTRTQEDNSDLRALFDGLALTGADRVEYLLDHVDIAAVVNYLVGLVVMGHGDCCDKNLYIYRDTEGTGLWQALPWDVDSAFGRGGVALAQSIFPQAAGIFTGRDNKLFAALLDDVPGFREMYLRRLRTLMDEFIQPPGTPPDELHFERRVDELVAQLAPDALLDFQKWGSWRTDPVTDVISYGQEGVPTWQEEVDILRNQYFPARRTYLYSALTQANGGQVLLPQAAAPPIRFGEIEFNPSSGNQDEEYITLTNPNEIAVDISAWQLTGGVQHTFHPGTVIPAGGTLYLTPDLNVFRTRESGPSGGQSLFVQGNYVGHISNHGASIRLVAPDLTVVDEAVTPSDPSPEQNSLRISEVMYHPRDPEPGSRFEDGDFEFIELVNTSDTETLDLEHVALRQGIDFVFPPMLLAPGQRVVVVRDRGAFEARYGPDVLIAGQYGGTFEDPKLANEGEAIRLEIATGDLIQEFTYDDAWLPATDGVGFSLTVIDPRMDLARWNTPDGWQVSRQLDGSPGTTDVTGGDFNGDGRVDVVDVDLLCAAHRINDARFDLTSDGSVDHRDVALLIQDLLGTNFGDADLDGTFDSGDLVRVFQAGEYEDDRDGNSTWSDGDWDCDGDFLTSDLVLALQAGGFSAAATASLRRPPRVTLASWAAGAVADQDTRLPPFRRLPELAAKPRRLAAEVPAANSRRFMDAIVVNPLQNNEVRDRLFEKLPAQFDGLLLREVADNLASVLNRKVGPAPFED